MMQIFRPKTIGLLLFLLCMSFGLKVISSSGDTTVNHQSLENLIFQADYIALVRLPNIPSDSLPYFVHDLGTTYYISSFEPIRVFKQNITLNDPSYTFVYIGYEKPGLDLYRPGEECYLFLRGDTYRELGTAPNLKVVEHQSLQPSMLHGGLIPRSALSSKKLKNIVNPSAFAKAARNGNLKKMRRMASRQLYNSPETNFNSWLLNQRGIDGVSIDSCTAHISIWPGWSDHYFWLNSPKGMKEFNLKIQHGTIYRVPFRMPRSMSNRHRVKFVSPADGAREANIKNCQNRAMWDARDDYNNRVQFRLDEGRLNWSIVGAPKHLDSDEPLMRLKLSLTNRGDSAMFLRWTDGQTQGRKLIQFVLEHIETRKVYRELNQDVFIKYVEPKDAADVLVIAAGSIVEVNSISSWHSINDPFVEFSDATAAHRFDSLPDGSYRLYAVYDPYPEAVMDTLSWNPYCDSLSAHAGYVFRVKANPPLIQTIRAKVIERQTEFTNEYGQKGYANGIVEVIQADSLSNLHPGDTIAFKMLLSPEMLDDNDFRPPFTHEIIRAGDIVELDLITNRAAYYINTKNGKHQIFGTPARLDSIRLEEN